MTPVASLPAAGRELDALIAEHVMGWIPLGIGPNGITAGGAGPLAAGWVGFWDGNWTRWTSMAELGQDDGEDRAKPWSPSTDIAAAWEVVEKLDEKWFVKIEKRGDRREEGRYFERWACHLWPGDFEAEAETAPLAICLAAVAALKAVAP